MLKRQLVLIAVLVGLAYTAFAAVTLQSPSSSVLTPKGLTGTLKPLSDGTFTFSATITDLRSGEALSAPQLHFASGETAAVTIERNSQDVLKLTVAADKAMAKATVELVEQHGSASVTLSRLDFQLQ